MSRVRLYMHRTNGWELATAGTTANQTDLPHMMPPCMKLQDLTLSVRGLYSELAALEASKAELVKTLRELLKEGDRLMDLLRTGARQHYGYFSGKLIEFGVQPLNTKSQAAAPKPPPPPLPEVPAPLPSTPDTTQ
jgi:hypothetical protein